MTTDAKNLAHKALLELMEIGRGVYGIETSWLYALTWLAAGRRAGMSAINNLLSADTWEQPWAGEIPADAKALVWSGSKDIPGASSVRAQSLGVITKLIEGYADQAWDLIDVPWYQSGNWRGDIYTGFALAPELCDLAFAMLDAPSNSSIWIPFDPTGQLLRLT